MRGKELSGIDGEAGCQLSALSQALLWAKPSCEVTQIVFNPSPAASHVLKPKEKSREFQREREKEEQKISEKNSGK